MQILLAAATTNEIRPTLDWLTSEQLPVQVQITQIGSTATAYALTRALANGHPSLVLQAGIGGSFKPNYPPGSLALIGEEVIADLGAVEQGALTDIFDMGFAASDGHPFRQRMLVNPWKERFGGFALDFVRGATVNSISASPPQIKVIAEKYDPVIESMEGAALHYVCLMEQVPFLQLRAVSNFAGERNKANWNIRDAIVNLNNKLREIIIALGSNPH